MGIEQAQDFYEQALVIEATGGLMLPDGSRRRTPGGVFFKIVREGVSKEERWKIFPAPGKGKKPVPTAWERPSRPAYAAPAAASAVALVQVITEIPNATGEARTVKLTLIGRSGRIIAKNGYILTTMTSSKVPVLPTGMPAPPTTPTIYTVYIGQKQWQKVAASLQSNPDDVLIAEGIPAYDPDLEGIAVYVTNTTTKLLQQGYEQPKQGHEQARQSWWRGVLTQETASGPMMGKGRPPLPCGTADGLWPSWKRDSAAADRGDTGRPYKCRNSIRINSSIRSIVSFTIDPKGL